MWGGGRERANFGEANPEQNEVGHLVVENEWFEGCCDAGDVIDGEECIISITRGSGGHGKRISLALLPD